MRIAIDWDDTLVDHASQAWLPGAQEALRRLLRAGHTLTIHSCRANWREGRDAVLRGLRDGGFTLSDDLGFWVGEGKPFADVYIDDRAIPFQGIWADTLHQVKGLRS